MQRNQKLLTLRRKKTEAEVKAEQKIRTERENRSTINALLPIYKEFWEQLQKFRQLTLDITPEIELRDFTNAIPYPRDQELFLNSLKMSIADLESLEQYCIDLNQKIKPTKKSIAELIRANRQFRLARNKMYQTFWSIVGRLKRKLDSNHKLVSNDHPLAIKVVSSIETLFNEIGPIKAKPPKIKK